MRNCVMSCCMQAAAFAQAQIKTIGNAVRKLSQELYSRQIHFVLELVQVSSVEALSGLRGVGTL